MRVDLLGGAAQTLYAETGGQSDDVPGQTSGHSSPDLHTSCPQTKKSLVMRPPAVEPVIFLLCGHRLRMKRWFVHKTVGILVYQTFLNIFLMTECHLNGPQCFISSDG